MAYTREGDPASSAPNARQQRLVFGEVAEIYHRTRPGYPMPLIDAVIAATGVSAPTTVEIGAGTGKATVLLAPHCASLVAIEPSPEMVAIASGEVRAHRHVEVVTSGFESWEPPAALEGALDLVACAQAWHWLDHATAIPKVCALLRPRGVLALFWNRPEIERTMLRPQLDEVYAREAPGLRSERPWQMTSDHDLATLRDTGCFTAFETREFEHSATYATADYLDLMSTQSDHRLIPPEQLVRLLAGLARVIDGAGGELTVPYTAVLVMGRRLDRAEY